MYKAKGFEKKNENSFIEQRKLLKGVELTSFVKQQFKQLERRNLSIPVQLFQL